MNTGQGAVTNTFDQSDDFMDVHVAVLGSIATCGARATLSEARRICDEHVVSQAAGLLQSKIATDSKQSLRVHLQMELMAPVSRVAAAEQIAVPELRPFRTVRGAPGDRRLIAAAAAMAETVVPYQDTFVAAGLAPDFVTQLVNATAALRATIATPQSRRRRAVGATAGLKTAIVKGRHAIRVLDSLIRVALKDDSTRLAEWNSAKRIGRKRTSTATMSPASAPVTTAAA